METQVHLPFELEVLEIGCEMGIRNQLLQTQVFLE